MSARLPDITSDPCVAERHNATRVYRTITMIRMTIPCKTDWVCGLAEPTDFELPRPAQVGRKVRRQRLHLPRTAATIRVSSSTPFAKGRRARPRSVRPLAWVATRTCTPGRRAGCPTCGRLFRIERNAVLVAADMHAAEGQFRHLAGEVFGGRSTSIRCESVPPETMSTLRDLSVCQPIWRYQACLPPSCSASRAHREIDQRNSKLFTEERFASYFPAQTITFPKRPKLAYE